MPKTDPFEDLAQDFMFNVSRGSSAQAAVAELREAYRTVLGDPAQNSAFVTTLAETAWHAGLLYPALLDEAVTLLTESSDADETAQILADKLRSPQPKATSPKRFWRRRSA